VRSGNLISAANLISGMVPIVGLLGLARRWLLVVRVNGQSMSPTYQPGDAVLARRRRGGRLPRGAVVICRLPEDIPGPDSYLVKRITAVGGDLVPGRTDGSRVPDGQVFVQGDNSASYDSRAFGPIDVRSVRGRVIGLRLPLRPRSGGS
jgi:signal peptidase I